MLVVSFTFRSPYQLVRVPGASFDTKLGGLQSNSVPGEEERSFLSCRELNHGHPFRSLVTILKDPGSTFQYTFLG